MGAAVDAVVSGQCDSHFTRVQQQFRDNFAPQHGPAADSATPAELGAALTVYVDGRRVVDIWGGYRDAARQQLWRRDTPVCVFSCTKGVLAILAMRLVQAGLLDYQAPVAKYWPEYACHGKEQTLVRHLLSHQAGVPVLEGSLPPGDIWRWQPMCKALANSTAQWQPGARHGYHALTFGYLVGGLLERAGGAPLATLLKRELCDVIGVAFSLGVSDERRAAVAELVGESTKLSTTPLAELTRLDSALLLTPAVANSEQWRNAWVPGANGHSSAADLAGIYQALLSSMGTSNEALNGTSQNLPQNDFLSDEVISQAATVQASGKDAVLGMQSAYGLGFQLPTNALTPGSVRSSSCFGHKGIYGATGFADPRYKLAVGYVMNRCGDAAGDDRVTRLLAAIYECLPKRSG